MWGGLNVAQGAGMDLSVLVGISGVTQTQKRWLEETCGDDLAHPAAAQSSTVTNIRPGQSQLFPAERCKSGDARASLGLSPVLLCTVSANALLNVQSDSCKPQYVAVAPFCIFCPYQKKFGSVYSMTPFNLIVSYFKMTL